MVPEDEARHTVELEDCYVILPAFEPFADSEYRNEKRCAVGFRYGSDNNDHWLTREELRAMVERLGTSGEELQ